MNKNALIAKLNGFQGISIIADSIPDNPESWGCEDWKFWHTQLEKKYGREVANQKFLHEWQKQGGFDYTYNWCKYGSDFVNYFASKGINMKSVFSALFTGGSEIIDGSLTTVKNAVDTVGNTAKVAKYIIPVVIILGVGGVAYYASKRGDKVLEIAKSITKKK